MAGGRGSYYWAPRVMGIVLALLAGILALDVFREEYGFWETLVALFMHLLPSLALVLVLVVAWRWEVVGGLLYLVLALIYLVAAGRGHLIRAMVVAAPFLALSILFFMSRLTRKPQPPARTESDD